MKAITVRQPWASLIACGEKKIETRSWATKYRGPIAIHAGKGLHSELKQMCYSVPVATALGIQWYSQQMEGRLFGSIIAIADLVDCVKVVGPISLQLGDEKRIVSGLENGMKIVGNELEFGDFSYGRYAWILANVRQIDPVPAKGRQRIWEWAGEQP